MQCLLMYSTDQDDVAGDSKGKKREILIASLVSVIGIVLLVLSLYLCHVLKKKNDRKMKKEGEKAHCYFYFMLELCVYIIVYCRNI